MSQFASRALAVGVGVLAAGLAASPAFAAGAHAAKKPTSLTLKAAHAAVAPRHKDALTATLKDGKTRLAGDRLYLEHRAAGTRKWSTPTAIKPMTNAHGQVTFPVVPGTHKGQKTEYEVLFKGTARFRPSHSSVITITVS